MNTLYLHIRFLLILILMTGCLSISAQGIGEVRFGSSREVASEAIFQLFGQPSSTDGNCYIYKNKEFEGFHWNEVLFRFTNDRLTEARFFMNQRSKYEARRKLTAISKVLAKKHVMSMDIEDDGNHFYAGGKSPLYYGHLFTLFISPREGRWTDQLRFGPFEFKN